MYRRLARLTALLRYLKPHRLHPVTYLGFGSLFLYYLGHQADRVHLLQDELPNEQLSFKMTQFNNTLFELRKDLDDFIVLVRVDKLSQKQKEAITLFLEKLYKNSVKNGRRLRVAYLNPDDLPLEKTLQNEHQLKIGNNTIFLVKNKYSTKLETFTMEDLAGNIQSLEIYFEPIVESQRQEVLKVIQKLDEKDVVLLYVGDDFDAAKLYDSEKKFKLAQRSVFAEKDNIKFLFVDKEEELVALGIPDHIPNHSHLILRHSNQSVTEPNLNINQTNYHLISNIQLYDQKGHLELDDYIDSVHTFSDNVKKYNLVFCIDKNYIDPDTTEEIVRALRDVKKTLNNPDISFRMEYQEENSPENWSIYVVDVQKLNESSSVYIEGVKSGQDLQDIGKHTHKYKLESSPTKENICDLITGVISGEGQEYFTTEKPKVIHSLHKLTGKTFKKHVLDNDKHHLVLQYSEHCQACKELAPVAVKFQTENSNHSIEVHRMLQDNVVKGQIIYPYSPVLLFYKNKWKPNPVQIPTEILAKDMKNLKTYCQILSQIETVDEEELQKHYFQAADLKWDNLPHRHI